MFYLLLSAVLASVFDSDSEDEDAAVEQKLDDAYQNNPRCTMCGEVILYTVKRIDEKPYDLKCFYQKLEEG